MNTQLSKTLEQVTKEHVVAVLNAHGGNKTQAAKSLGITLKTLYNWLHRWGIFDQHRTHFFDFTVNRNSLVCREGEA